MGLTSAQATVLIVPSLVGLQKKVAAGVRATKAPDIEVQVTVDRKSLAKAERDVRAASDRVSKARGGEEKATEDLRLAEARLAEVRAKSAAGSSRMVQAENSLNRAKRASVQASTAASKAAADEERAVSRVAAARKKLDQSLAGGTRRMRISVDYSSLNRAAVASRRLDSSLLSLGKAGGIAALGISGVAVAGAAIATLPGVLASVASSVGVLVGSFAGVGDALKAYQQDQDAARAAGAKTASAAASDARAIGSAQQSISDARRNAARVARSGSEAIAEAAKRAADVEVEGQRSIRSAMATLAGARRTAADAERDYQDAVKETVSALRDLKVEFRSSALSVTEAELNLDRAKQRLEELKAAGTGDILDMREANIGVRRASLSLEEAKNRYADVKTESEEANRTGVAGARNVVDAQRGVQDANRGVADAERDVATARADAARDNLAAQAEIRTATRDAAEANQDAARQVADAIKSLSDTQLQQAESAATAAGETSKFAEAMAKLSPAARELVTQLLAMGPAFTGLKNAAGENFLPGVTQMLKDSQGLFPILEDNLRRTGAIMGDTARKFGDLFKSEEFQRNLEQMFRNAEPITRAIGDLFLGVTDSVVRLGARSKDTQDGFADFLGALDRGISEMFDKLSTPEADKAFGELWRSLGELLEFVLPLLADLAVWCAEKVAPAIRSLTDFLERNRDSLGSWALAIGGAILALKGIRGLSNMISIVRNIGGAFGLVRTDADKASTAVGKDKNSGIRGKLNALKRIGRITIGIAIVAVGLEAIGAAGEAIQNNNPGQNKKQEDRTISEEAQHAMGGTLASANENPLGGFTKHNPIKDPFKWFFGRTPTEFASGVKNSLFGKLSEQFDGTIGAWLDTHVAIPVQTFFRELPSKITGFSDQMGLWAENNIRQPILRKTGELGTGVRNFFTNLPATIGGWSESMGLWAENNVRQPILRKAGELGNGVRGFFTNLPATIGGWSDQLGMWAENNIRQPILRKAGELGSGIREFFRNLPTTVAGWGDSLGRWAEANIREPVVRKASELYTGVTGWFGRAKQWVTDRATEWGIFLSGWAENNIRKPVVDKFWELYYGATGWFGRAKQWVSDRASELGTFLGNWAENNIRKPVVDKFWGLYYGATDAIGSAKTWVIDRARELKDGFVGHINNLVDSVGRKWDELKGFFAHPIKWVIDEVWNGTVQDLWGKARGLIPSLPAFEPLASGGLVGYATGGLLRGPGSGTSDSILGVGSNGVPTARVSNGEFVINKRVTDKALPFLRALNAGNGEALQAAGGLNPVTRKFRGKSGIGMLAAGGPVEQRIAEAKRWMSDEAQGIPYVWGGGGRNGMDCSGMVAAVTHVLSGRSPYSGRIGSTATMLWGGFAPGLHSAWSVGNKPSDHMAGTLAGDNVEQHGPAGTPFAFPSRWGADNGYFNQQWHLPVVGGEFVSGGTGGLGSQIINMLMRLWDGPANGLKELVAKNYPGDQLSQRIPKDGTNQILDAARSRILEFAGEMGGGDVTGISGPVVDQVREVAARFGWSDGGMWDSLYKLINQESSWDPTAANSTSSARGLMQKMVSLHGPVEPTAAGQAMWGLNYIRQNYGDPMRAWAEHQRKGWYHNGGVIPGVGNRLIMAQSGERVLTRNQTESFDRLVASLPTTSAAVRQAHGGHGLDGFRHASASGKSVVVNNDNKFVETIDIDSAMSRVAFMAGAI